MQPASAKGWVALDFQTCSAGETWEDEKRNPAFPKRRLFTRRPRQLHWGRRETDSSLSPAQSGGSPVHGHVPSTWLPPLPPVPAQTGSLSGKGGGRVLPRTVSSAFLPMRRARTPSRDEQRLAGALLTQPEGQVLWRDSRRASPVADGNLHSGACADPRERGEGEGGGTVVPWAHGDRH